MTDEKMELFELIEKRADVDFVREMLAFAAARLMSFEAEAAAGAAYGVKSPDRAAQRNGYRERTWDTRVGAIDLKIPRLRTGYYLPSFLDPRKTAEKALVAVIQEAYVQGVSTRGVDDLVRAMGAGGVSKSQVSRLVGEIDERVQAFLNRPIEGEWPYLWIDATYLKARQGGRVTSTAVIVAVGVNTEGRREVLGVASGPSEAEPFWTAFLRSLADRGLRGVKLVIADDHRGLRAAASRVFHATQQRCRDFVHDWCADGQKIKCQTVTDEITKEGLAIEVDGRIRSTRVSDVLARLISLRGAPAFLRSDNGPEFVSRALLKWATEQKIDMALIDPGKPWQNGAAESFNGKFRDECLNMEWFRSRAEAKIEIERWRKHYNEVRPHSSLGYQTPAAFARSLAGAPSAAAVTTGRAAALTRGFAPRPVDQPSRMGHEGKADLADVSS